jgi:hypothetical protein
MGFEPRVAKHLLIPGASFTTTIGGVLLDKVGGVDVHRDTLTATVLGDDVKETRKFGVDLE